VAAADLLAVVRDVAEVVPVAQHQRQLVDRDPLGWPARGRPSAEPAVVEFVVEVGEGVVTRRVQLESQLDERRSFRVDSDGADLAAARFRLTNVEVAESCNADRATAADLLAHLVADVRAAGLRLVLVDGVQDGFHHGALGAFAHVEDGGDDPGAVLL